MIPEKIRKIEKREELAEIIESLSKYGYSNIELGRLLGEHKNRISGLRTKRSNYPMSLKKLEPLLLKAKDILSQVKEQN